MDDRVKWAPPPFLPLTEKHIVLHAEPRDGASGARKSGKASNRAQNRPRSGHSK